MSTAVADPPVAAAPAPAAGAAAPTPAPAAGSPAGAVAAGSGAGAAAAAPVQTGAAVPAVPAAATSLLADAPPAGAAPADKAPEPAKVDAAAPPAADWKLEAPKDSPAKAEDVQALEQFAKAQGLTKTQAEKLLERDLAGRTASEAAAKAQADDLANALATQVEKHAEFGGAKLPQTLAAAKRALAAFTTPDERKAFVASPLGNHPALIALLARAAAALPAEDAPPAHAGGDASALADAFANPAQAIYAGKLPAR